MPQLRRWNASASAVRKWRSTLRTQTLATSKSSLADEVDSLAKHMMNVTPGSFAEATRSAQISVAWKGYASPVLAPPHDPALSQQRTSTRLLESPILRSRCFPLSLINPRIT